MKVHIQRKFFVFNPKSYLFGEELISLARIADGLAKQYPHITIFMTAPYTDLYRVRKETKHIIVTAQHMDGVDKGRGMGTATPASLADIGVGATFLNHAEYPLSLSQLIRSIEYARKFDLVSIACADSLNEARAIATLNPDIILCEPSELIGTGQTSDAKYVHQTKKTIKALNPNILVMQAAGIVEANDVYNVIKLGADGTGCTSGIVKAPNPAHRLKEMVQALCQAMEEGT